MKGRYIYGIIKSNGMRKNFVARGIGDNGVSILEYKNLSAVVSTAPLQKYETLAKQETVKDLVLHQKVIEEVMEQGVLPVKFGTMLARENEVIEVMARGYSKLLSTLRKMSGKLEVNLVALWETWEVIERVYQENKKIQKQQERVAKSQEGQTLREKIILGRMVAEELARRKGKYARMIMDSLGPLAADICLHRLFEEDVVFNAAFLLEKAKQKGFEKEVEKLDKKFAGKLNFRLVGPLPPYSFATILVRRFRKEEVEQAKRILGLNAEPSLREVKEAYHRQAERLHPDKGGSSLEFSVVATAYKLLREVCHKGSLSVEILKWREEH